MREVTSLHSLIGADSLPTAEGRRAIADVDIVFYHDWMSKATGIVYMRDDLKAQLMTRNGRLDVEGVKRLYATNPETELIGLVVGIDMDTTELEWLIAAVEAVKGRSDYHEDGPPLGPVTEAFPELP